MRSWQRHRVPFAVILAFWIFCMWVNGWTKQTEREIRGIQAKTEPVVYNNLTSRIVGKECSNTTGHCYIIMDVFCRQGGMAVALRLLLLNRLPKYAFTSVSLKPSDPARGNWSVDKSLVDSHVIQAQIGFAFITEAMSFNSVEKQQFLMIGLGGGVASNFLSTLPAMGIQAETTVVELDPFMVGLAARYFEHREVPGLTNIVVANGIKFLEDAVKKGTKYRSILLDACYNTDETATGLLCPVKEFLEPQTVKNIYLCLEDGGVFTINTISDSNATRHEQQALEQFQKVFPSCYLAPYHPDRNMLVCSKRSHWTWKEQSHKFRTNLEPVIAKFNFQTLGLLRGYYGPGSSASSSPTVSLSFYLIFIFFFTY